MRPTSPPEQKALPAPVTITTFTLGSACASCREAAQRSIIDPVKAFILSGRLSVMVAMRSFTS